MDYKQYSFGLTVLTFSQEILCFSQQVIRNRLEMQVFYKTI